MSAVSRRVGRLALQCGLAAAALACQRNNSAQPLASAALSADGGGSPSHPAASKPGEGAAIEPSGASTATSAAPPALAAAAAAAGAMGAPHSAVPAAAIAGRAMTHDHPPIAGAPGPGHIGAQVAAKAPEVRYALPSPSKGETPIAEVRARRLSLTGTPVRVRGVVVKVTRAVLGRDYVHLRDTSTGEAGLALVATTTVTVEPGWTVIAEASLATDVDVGGVMRYDALLRDATLKRVEDTKGGPP